MPSNRVKQAGEQNSSGSANHTPGIILADPVEQADERHPLGNSNHAREPNGNRDRSPTTLRRKTPGDEIDRNHQENDGEGNNSENKSNSGAANGDGVSSEAVGENQTPESVVGLDAEAQNASETSTAGQP
ncbi:hypothetical protein THOM_1603 [Trachipleistophora hominis]|uniref:Uncharacterized protein n=1 Tax=Trachipleistophora hominis TaxID=72359 RepID=L7JVJ4_TRAHO|nr:hypothetical protein THOM_1603 [Trachipleistophora hominis]